ncbi:hypothetical protein DSAG12_03021 [Promethearchaeum syntrophicum]|uniref:Uncharacterized protein n=1 Tax=Promethearchaeum syntrophicum TaxID=2594042 RepID=A0A5B9DCZ7_9ARCH|nr:hypothetical protein [Candidatus Prometheoarchaeum syntrophicum]QEE17189.1 hypothetical protein DSAG12_03021 [Candidatus Prometheoarchaeum syntrophicum]
MEIENSITDDQLSILEYYYIKLRGKIKLAKKKSLYTYFLKASLNRNFKIIQSSVGFFPEKFSNTALEELIDKKLIYEMKFRNKYTISGKGIFFYELAINKLSVIDLVDNLERFFDFDSKAQEKLKESEKIILTMMLCLRSFSSEEKISIKDNLHLESLDNLIGDIIKFLSDEEITKKIKTKNEFYKSKKKRIETETDYGPLVDEYILYEAFHNKTRDLPKRSEYIFCSTGNKEYYLNLTDESMNLSYEKIEFLINKILNSVPTNNKHANLKRYLEFLEEKSLEKISSIMASNKFNKIEVSENIRNKILFGL